MTNKQNMYEEWLTTIANTRLIFNTTEELESFLEAPSIHSNGIKRCFTSPQRLRSAFRDLQAEIFQFTEGQFDLELVMTEYKKAWSFFRQNLLRKSSPYSIAMDLLSFYYHPNADQKLKEKTITLFEKILEEGISIPFIILMLLKVIPGYDSKDGDIEDISILFDKALELMHDFCDNTEYFVSLPIINRAHQESRKSRITLLFHIYNILNTYESYSSKEALYNTIETLNNLRVPMDIEGFWTEGEDSAPDGRMHSTDFWQIESLADEGTYCMTHWHKDAENTLTGISYVATMFEDQRDQLVCYMIHPQNIQNRINKLAYSDHDHTWYQCPMPESLSPQSLPLYRLYPSKEWQARMPLTRLSHPEDISICQQWLDTCHIHKPYAHLEYTFVKSIYAITPHDIYIQTDKEGEYFRVPKSINDSFHLVTLNDDVGIMTMDGRRYLTFDELLLYIPITPKELKKYGITRVKRIE